jgi:sigma-B regulation protein RsbU (phosphoserine phosphatase)
MAHRRLVAVTIVAALVGPLLGLGAQRMWRSAGDGRALGRLDEEAAYTARALQAQVADGRRAVVAAAALLSASTMATGEEFTRFAIAVTAQGSALRALSWAPLVPLDARARHEAEGRREFGPGYEITERAPSGVLTAAARRQQYFPVRFIVPVAGNEAALGFDLASEPTRDDALAVAAATGQAAISGMVRLVQEQGTSMGFLLAVPVFRAPRDEGGSRQLSGFATGVFRVDDLLAAAVPNGPARGSRDMVVELIDHTGLSSVVEASGAPTFGGGSPPAEAIVRRAVKLVDRSWTLVARPTPAFLARFPTHRAVLVGFGVFLGYELLLAFAVTAQRWGRERVRRKRAEFAESVIQSVREGVVVADTAGRMIAVNPAARRMLGSGNSRVPPWEWPAFFGLFVPGTDRHVAVEDLPLLRAIRGEEVPETDLFVRNERVPDGAWASVTGAPLREPGGELVGGVVVFRDITEQRRAQELSQRLTNAVEQAADCVFITDRNGVIEYVNPSFEATTGYSRSEAIGQTPRLLKSGLQSGAYYASLWATIGSGEPFKAAVVNRRKSGEHFHAEQTITPMRDPSSGEITHFVSVLRDMTEHIKLREDEIQMRLGKAVQKRLFPQNPPAVPGYDIAGAVASASETSGDYFDFIQLPDGQLALGIADVSGHGVGSALIMTATRAYLRSLVTALKSVDALAVELNRLLYADLEEERFVTMILAVLDPTPGRLRWVNVAHPTGYVLDGSGAVKAELKSGSRPLGLFDDMTCAEAPAITLEPGDTLLLLTDGILEATSPEGQEFGPAGVQEVLHSAGGCPAEELVARLIAAARSFAGEQPQQDDLTVVVCRRLVS